MTKKIRIGGIKKKERKKRNSTVIESISIREEIPKKGPHTKRIVT